VGWSAGGGLQGWMGSALDLLQAMALRAPSPCTPRDLTPAQIHWFSIVNSCVTVLLLTGFLATILMRVRGALGRGWLLWSCRRVQHL